MQGVEAPVKAKKIKEKRLKPVPSAERTGKKPGRKSKEADVAGVFLRSFKRPRKDGTFYQYFGKIWYISYPVLDPITGNTDFKHKSSRSTVKSEAERQLNILKTAHYNSLKKEEEPVKPKGTMTLWEFMNDEYLCDPEVIALAGYSQILQQAGEMVGGLDPRYVKITTRGKPRVYNPMHLGKIRLKDITAVRFKAYLQVKTDKGLAVSTNNKHIALFQRVMHVAYIKKMVEHNAVDESKILEKKEENNSRINNLTPELMNLLLDEVEKKSLQHRQFIELAFACGIRKNRVYSLTLDMIDLNENEICIPKDKHGQEFQADLGDTAVRVLTDRLCDIPKFQTHRYIFSNPKTNTCWSDIKKSFIEAKSRAIAIAFKKNMNAKGLVSFTFHDTRHTFISALVNVDVPIDQIQKLAGHRDARSTDRYTHRDKKLMKKAIKQLPY